MPSSTLFDTAIGRCGIAWTDDGVVAVALPEPSDEALLDYLTGFGAAEGPVDALAADAIGRIVALLDGRTVDMSPIPLLLQVSEFDASVYTVCSGIPLGATLTYGHIARRLGHPGADHRPVPSGARRRHGSRRLLGTGWYEYQTKDSRYRRGPGIRRADVVLNYYLND